MPDGPACPRCKRTVRVEGTGFKGTLKHFHGTKGGNVYPVGNGLKYTKCSKVVKPSDHET